MSNSPSSHKNCARLEGFVIEKGKEMFQLGLSIETKGLVAPQRWYCWVGWDWGMKSVKHLAHFKQENTKYGFKLCETDF